MSVVLAMLVACAAAQSTGGIFNFLALGDWGYVCVSCVVRAASCGRRMQSCHLALLCSA